MRKTPIIIVLALLVAAVFVQAQTTYNRQEPIYVTAAAGDSTITFHSSVAAVQVAPTDDIMWISYSPGGETPFPVSSEDAYTVATKVTSLTLHRTGTTACLVTPVFK